MICRASTAAALLVYTSVTTLLMSSEFATGGRSDSLGVLDVSLEVMSESLVLLVILVGGGLVSSLRLVKGLGTSGFATGPHSSKHPWACSM